MSGRFTIRLREDHEGGTADRERLVLEVMSVRSASNRSSYVHWLDERDVDDLARTVERWRLTAAASTYRLLVCGSRDWDDPDPIRHLIRSRVARRGATRVIVIHGDARGADTLAEGVARGLGVHTARVGALWGTDAGGYGRAAGPIRNGVMLGLAPHEVVGFHPGPLDGSGTGHMLAAARREGIPVKWWRGPA